MSDLKIETRCNPSAIDRLLNDRLTEAERAVVEKHLDGCADCRARLERLAAEPGVWAEAREFLSSAEQIVPGSEPASSAASGQGAWRSEEDLPRADLILNYLTASDDPRMLGRLAGYEIAGVIGHGGMGVVLKGLDVALNRYVAIKVLAPHLATSAAARLRFAREARAAAAVVHENVIAIHAVSEANSLPYLVMPYVRGTSLQKRLDAQGPLTATEISRIGMQAAAGLAAAHAQGLVHRDIKPANILLEDGVERLTITDFGLARAADDASLTRSGVIAGTPQFMSPEQARGESIDRRSDLFSLGSVLYALCTGHAPFRAETSYGVLRRISDDRPRPIRDQNPEIPEWLCAIVDRLHAKAPAERFESADDVARLFEQCLAHVQQPNVVPLPEELRRPRPAPAAASRRQSRVAAIVVVGLLAVTAFVWFTWTPVLPVNQVTVPSPRNAFPPDDPTPANDAVADSESLAMSPPGEVMEPAHAWEDGTAEAIDELAGEIADTEQMFEGGWDRVPPEPRDPLPQSTEANAERDAHESSATVDEDEPTPSDEAVDEASDESAAAAPSEDVPTDAAASDEEARESES